jgi:hypothetical protein
MKMMRMKMIDDLLSFKSIQFNPFFCELCEFEYTYSVYSTILLLAMKIHYLILKLWKHSF